MAEIVAGFASSHSPLMALTGPLWDQFAKQNDPRNRELVKPPHGRHLSSSRCSPRRSGARWRRHR